MKASDIIKETTQRVYQKIDSIRKEKNISWSDIVAELQAGGCQVSRTSPNDWKNGKSTSFLNYIGEIANALGVSTEDIQTSETPKITENNLSEMEETLVRVFRATTPDGRFEMIAALTEIKNRIEKKHTESDAKSIG